MTASQPPQPPPRLEYWHLWTDDGGCSRQTLCQLPSFLIGVLGPGNSPQWSHDLMADGNAFLTELPVGWTASWHINLVPKWIFVLRGSWYIESMDGQRQVFGPGSFSFGGDQNCIATADGRIGHLSGQVGAEACLQLIIQRNDGAWNAVRPGAFS
ncbi:MAG: cupin domain-containing protein [Cyanobacteriota bacterium]|jgi:hypothetical protein